MELNNYPSDKTGKSGSDISPYSARDIFKEMKDLLKYSLPVENDLVTAEYDETEYAYNNVVLALMSLLRICAGPCLLLDFIPIYRRRVDDMIKERDLSLDTSAKILRHHTSLLSSIVYEICITNLSGKESIDETILNGCFDQLVSSLDSLPKEG